MSNITTLPNNLSYYASQDKKEDGSPILVLNISQTYVEAIPERLMGVDRVVAREGQVKYIAPDYNGEVVVAPQGQAWKRRSLTPREIGLHKRTYQTRNSMAHGIFNQSYKANEICSGYPDEEIHLPAGLRFSWNARTRKGHLDAQKTLIQQIGLVANIASIKLASPEVIQDRLDRQAKFIAQCRKKNERRDHDLISSRTHNSVSKFHKSQMR